MLKVTDFSAHITEKRCFCSHYFSQLNNVGNYLQYGEVLLFNTQGDRKGIAINIEKINERQAL